MFTNKIRLNKISELIEQKIVYDIGSDHGYLPIKMLEDKTVDFAYICEKNKQPLKNALRNFEKRNLLHKGEFILSDGFLDLNEIKRDSAIVIAGMGGNLIAEIITGGLDKIDESLTLYLQPNNNAKNLRKFLFDNSFTIHKQVLICENNIINEIFVCAKCDEIIEYNIEDIMFGDYEASNPLYTLMWENRLNHLLNVKSKVEENNQKNPKIDKEIKLIKDKLGE